jgi:hypothetical protein
VCGDDMRPSAQGLQPVSPTCEMRPSLMEWWLILEKDDGGRRSCPIAPLIIDDITNVSGLLTILLLPTVLSYPPMHIIVIQTSIAAGRGCCFTSGLP